MQILALRLHPDQDLRQGLQAFALEHHLQAGFVLTGIGSLKVACMRFADQPTSQRLEGKFEILSLAGTVSVHGLHLHMAIANSRGETWGGHVDHGCIIYTTAEIVVGSSSQLRFIRQLDPHTGFQELQVLAAGDRSDPSSGDPRAGAD